MLIDAGRRWDRRRVFAELDGREISMVALTHVHPDHQGVAKDVCEALDVPLACHADDVDAMEGRRPVQEAHPKHPVNRVFDRLWTGPPHKVDRVLDEGDEVAGFRVVHAPGHARGEVDLLPRFRPGRDLRRRDPQHELRDGSAGDQGAAGDLHL